MQPHHLNVTSNRCTDVNYLPLHKHYGRSLHVLLSVLSPRSILNKFISVIAGSLQLSLDSGIHTLHTSSHIKPGVLYVANGIQHNDSTSTSEKRVEKMLQLLSWSLSAHLLWGTVGTEAFCQQMMNWQVSSPVPMTSGTVVLGDNLTVTS